MKSKKIALIGANGQLGNDLQKVFSAETNYAVFPLTHEDIEITDPQSIAKALNNVDSDILINTAAYNKVDEIEKETQKAFLVNGIANKYLAEYCQKKDITFIYISTDYVFGVNEERKTPYIESDRPGPINTYGISKLVGEYFIQYNCKKYFIVRTSGLFGKAGSSTKRGNFIESVFRSAEEKQKIQVVNDQILTPTHTLDLARQILLLIRSNHYGVYHATAEGECSWYEFAKAIFEFTKMNVKLEAISSSEFKAQAKRPKYSVLENRKLKELHFNIMKPWQEGLREYLTL